MRRRIAVITYHGDLHALAVQALLRRLGDECSVLTIDRLAGAPSLSWSCDGGRGAAVVRDTEGRDVEIATLDALWWRRNPGEPRNLKKGQLHPSALPFVTNNVRAAFTGLIVTEFTGTWVDHPDSIRRAENKLIQLRIAQAEGLSVPATLVSQNPGRIRAFFQEQKGKVIVKSVASAFGVPALTGRLRKTHLADDEPLELAPAVYQAFVPGTRHLRVHCFGDRVQAALIETKRLDWRFPLDAKFRPYAVPPKLHAQLRAVLARLELSMGVFDLKLTPEGRPVWLELNPQGQFLFVEAYGGGSFIREFAQFLHERAELAGRSTRAPGKQNTPTATRRGRSRVATAPSRP